MRTPLLLWADSETGRGEVARSITECHTDSCAREELAFQAHHEDFFTTAAQDAVKAIPSYKEMQTRIGTTSTLEGDG